MIIKEALWRFILQKDGKNTERDIAGEIVRSNNESIFYFDDEIKLREYIPKQHIRRS